MSIKFTTNEIRYIGLFETITSATVKDCIIDEEHDTSYKSDMAPRFNAKDIAKYLSDLGVNVIIGTHSHVVQPIEFVGDTLVIYSLGNFISSQIGVEKLTGLVASIDIKKTTVDGKVSLELLNPKADLVYTCKPAICGKYKVYPYNKLTNNILPNYKNYYKKYMKIVRSLDNNIDTIYSKLLEKLKSFFFLKFLFFFITLLYN